MDNRSSQGSSNTSGSSFKEKLTQGYQKLQVVAGNVIESDSMPMIRRCSGGYMVENDEDIRVDPSAELIPDEYEHKDNKSGLVIVFCGNFPSALEDKRQLTEALLKHGYEVPEENVFKVASKKNVLEDLKMVAEKDYSEKSCLLVIFIGRYLKDGEFLPESGNPGITCMDVWKYFVGNECSSFRNKAKVFIFQAIEFLNPNATDTAKSDAPVGAHEVPAEGDVLIIYNKVEGKNEITDGDSIGFVPQLCHNMSRLGQKEDVIGLVTHSNCGAENRPVIISTLTRKFYLRNSRVRGYHFELDVYHNKVNMGVKELHKIIDDFGRRVSQNKTSNNGDEEEMPRNYKVVVDVADAPSQPRVRKKKPIKERPVWRY